MDEARRAAILARINATDWEKVGEDCGLEPEDMKRDALAAFEEYPDGLWSRDTGQLVIRGVSYCLTGGPSWGYAPTECYDRLNDLDRVPGLFEQLEQWAIADGEQAKPRFNLDQNANAAAIAEAQRNGTKVWFEVAEIFALLDKADAALNGDSNDKEHDCLFSVRESIANVYEMPERHSKTC